MGRCRLVRPAEEGGGGRVGIVGVEGEICFLQLIGVDGVDFRDRLSNGFSKGSTSKNERLVELPWRKVSKGLVPFEKGVSLEIFKFEKSLVVSSVALFWSSADSDPARDSFEKSTRLF